MIHHHPYTRHTNSGFFLVIVLVFGAIFFTISSAFIGYIVTQSKVVEQRYELDLTSDIAEAGLNYYKWYLAHYPNDVTNGTGLPGPYVHTYYDPEGGAIGEFSLQIASTTYCGDVASLDVQSTGTLFGSDVQRTISARYARPTVAEYAFIINSNVWAGSSLNIVGPYHSNQGIRMDGTNNSTVTSGVTTWSCTATFGCSPTSNRAGVFTTTGNANPLLFSYPSTPINFNNLTIDLANIQNRAQNNGGIYIPPSGNFGYRVTFNGNGTVTFRRVTQVRSYDAYSQELDDHTERNIIQTSTAYSTHTINANCPLIYVADKVWLEGVVDQKVTIAAAGTDNYGNDPDLILQGNITYADPANDGLLAVGENNVLLGVDVPDTMNISGIFGAQKGRFGRNDYNYADLPNPSGPLDYRPYYERQTLNMTGTVVSNGRVGTQWVSGTTFQSGFRNRNNTYDRNLVDSPPPLVPNTSDVYEFIEWREEN